MIWAFFSYKIVPKTRTACPTDDTTRLVFFCFDFFFSEAGLCTGHNSHRIGNQVLLDQGWRGNRCLFMTHL